MASESNKKLSIIYILKILTEFSDENHLLTQTEIANKINSIYGMMCERKSIASNIDSLIELGFDIIKIPQKGCFLGERILENSEVSFIIDALFSSQSIDGKQAKQLSEKLSKLLSKYQRKKYNYIYKSEQVNRTENRELFYNIDIIHEAIEKNKKISFKYKRLFFEKEQSNKIHIVNPYFLINNHGKYYLVCNYDFFNNLNNYKVDLISDIKVINENIKPINQIAGYEKGIDIAKYVNEHIYAFSDQIVNAILKIDDEQSVQYVLEWFGNKTNLYKSGNDIMARVVSNEQSLIYWCLQYGKSVELIEPTETRNKIKQQLDIIYNKYGGNING